MESPITTRVALLQALREGPGYGRDLIRRVARITEGELRLSAARVYPCLEALERDGLASARKVAPRRKRGGRSRTYYELTPRGVEASSGQSRILRAIALEPRAVPSFTEDRRLMARRLLAAEELYAAAILLAEGMHER